MYVLKITRETQIGVVVVALLALAFWGINYLKQNDVFNERRTFYAVYNTVDGLTKDRLVFIHGMQVGRVVEVRFAGDGTGRIFVAFEMDNPFPISTQTTAKIVSQDLLGTKAIELILDDSPDVAQTGDTLKSAIELNLTEEVNKQVAPIKQKAEQLIGSIDTVMLYVQSLLNERTRDNISSTFASINRSFETLENTVTLFDQILTNNEGAITGSMANLESITANLKANNEHLEEVMKNTAQLTDSLANMQLATTVNALSETVTQLNEVLNAVSTGEGSLGKLINDPAVYDNLNAATRELDELLYDIKMNPSRYVRVSVFGGSKQYVKPEENRND